MPSLFLSLLLLLAGQTHLTSSMSQELEVKGQRTARNTNQDSIKVVISEACATHGDSSDVNQGGKEMDLAPGSPLVLTHRIKLVAPDSGSRPGLCGCEADFAALRERLERLEREVSTLREKCGGAEGGCCTSKESKGAGCSIKPDIGECPNECSDQGRCMDGKCVCFPGFSGLDCSSSNCPRNCNDNGRCVNGQCVCDPGFVAPDCSQKGCPDNCNDQGRCVNGKCVCDSSYTGSSCSDKTCPGNCNDRGRCINGECVCDSGFTGLDCSNTLCLDNCNNHGKCINGKCECDSGFVGDDCSAISCPENCNSRGRCVNGQCVCDDGFTGSDCSERTCPSGCGDHGKCVNGKCECDGGFTGDDCSEISCPGNCNDRGRCVDGQCACDDGFTGPDCSDKACPNNCSNHGKCVNGKCVCNVGFAGPDCGAKGCPNNCNSKGRCVKARCVCRRGFRGPDCSQCEEGMTGPNCDTVMSGVSQLSTTEVTETSVTLAWTPPPIPYDTYHITFTSQKEGDQEISVPVEGSLTTFTQTGLAAGQEYTVSISGEVGGQRGAESTTQFMTLVSGPTNLQVVKTTSSSAVVQWEQSQGEIDRYRMTVSPNDGAGRSQEMTIQPDRDSAHIQELEAGRLYDIVLVAEKGSSHSGAATTQVVPGNIPPKVSMAAVTTQVMPSLGKDVDVKDEELSPPPKKQVVDQQGNKRAGSLKAGGIIRISEDPLATVTAITKPVVSRKDGSKPKLAERPFLLRKPNAPSMVQWNTTRVAPGDKRPLKTLPTGLKRKVLISKKPKPGPPTTEHRTISLAAKDVSGQTSQPEMIDARNQAQMSGTDSGSDSPSSSDEPTVPVAIKKKPWNITEVQGGNTTPETSEPARAGQINEKKCINKIKVTHIRLPKKDRGGGCKGDGTVLGGHQDSSDADVPPSELELSSEESEDNISPDPLHELLKDTLGSLNITTFSIHLSEPPNLSVDDEAARKQILRRLKPLSSQSVSQSSSQSAAALSSSSTESTSPSKIAGTASSPQPSASPPTSSSSFSSEKSDSLESNPVDVDSNRNSGDAALPENRKVPSRESSAPVFRRTPTKPGYVRRPRPIKGPFQNRTHLHLRTPHRSHVSLKLIQRNDTSTGELSPSSISEESSAVQVNVTVGDKNQDKDGTTTLTYPGSEQLTKRLPDHSLQYVGPFQNRTRSNLRFLTRPPQPLKPEKLTSSPDEPATSSPIAKELHSAEGTGPILKNSDDRGQESMSSDFNQTRHKGSPHPAAKVNYKDPYGGPLQNRTRAKLRPPQPPHRGPMRKPFPNRNVHGSWSVPAGAQTRQLEKENSLEISDTQLRGQNINSRSQDVQIRQAEDQGTAEVIQEVGHDTTIRPQVHQLENGDNDLNQTSKSREETRNPDSTSDSVSHEKQVNVSKKISVPVQSRPITTHTSTVSRYKVSRPISAPKKQPQTRRIAAQSHTQMRNVSGSQREEDTPNMGSKTELMKISDSESKTGSSEVTRESLDNVKVTNRTSGGFRVVWDAPEGKYKNFVVTSKEAGKPKEAKEEKHQGVQVEKEVKHQPYKEAKHGGTKDENTIPESVSKPSLSIAEPATHTDKTIKKVLPGSARSFKFEDLLPQTEYAVTLLGKGPGLLSRLHKLVISTGPEPPTNIVFSEVTEDSLTVSWTKPNNPVHGFKVTYTNTEDGEPVSVSVDWEDSALGLSQLSPGSSYEVSVISILGLDESDPIKDVVKTLPDPPTDLQAINITDTKALLLWRPALATIDKYTIVYNSGKESELRVTVSGNAAEQQLSTLEGSTTYTVTIRSQLGDLESSPATTSFTTAEGSGGDEDAPRDLQASHVTPRTTLLSWKPPTKLANSYKLVYKTEGQEEKEVIVDAMVTEYNLTRLHPGAKYTAQLQAEEGGRYTSAVATEFTTGTLRFPFPSDCSQELLNGIRTSGEVEIFPQGKDGAPVMVYCDMDTDDGGWTVFQRRKDGSVDFFRSWKDYVKGFGDLSGEFWLGLDSLHNLTTMTKMVLRIDLRDGDESVFAKYSTFEVAKRHYRLTVGGYSGTAGDSLSYHNNRIFSTRDRDPAPFITRCAMSYRGGWWYKNCHEANLNGLYGIDVKHQGVIWTSWKGKDFSVPFTEMKMRPAAFSPPSSG